MSKKAEPTPSLGKATATSTTSKKKLEKAAIEEGKRYVGWIIGIFIALLPPIWSVFGGHVLYGDNEIVSEQYIGFAKEFFLGGDLLWIAVALLVTSLIHFVFDILKKRKRAKEKKETIIDPYVLVILGICLTVLGIGIYMGNIINPITDIRMLLISIAAFVLFAIISGYLVLPKRRA